MLKKCSGVQLMHDDALCKMTPILSWRNAVSRERLSASSSPETASLPAAREQEKKRRADRFAALRAIHALQLYGAAGVAAFGWGISRLLDFSCVRYAPLWFAGAVLVYNLDRLKHDPSDALNTPERLRQHGQLRRGSIALAALAALVLVALPICSGDWLLLLLTPVAALVSLSYSFPIFGFRFKDVPAVKTLFAPTIVLIAYLAPVLLNGELPPSTRVFSAAVWSECLLLFNMVMCDLRDLAGDRAHGTRSIPVLLGERKTQFFLLTLLAAQFFLALANGWILLGFLCAVYLAALLLALRQRKAQPESFYEWFVEGILFLPALAALAKLWK
jgi:4-hydroxybenzoate polyprenyltransferase